MTGVKHYTKDVKPHTGGTHKMPNGETHSGKTHTASSKKLFHFKDLPKSVQRRIIMLRKKKG